ncbi:putative DNA-directed DNA polymerase [Microsporum canis]|uniref:High-affinity nickel transport protein n=1 Tax=Arthroderma otae (strain ATCC MYA-4605 / CBS 113480) TaxID=554155 RepID=C5FPS2_ARTOC|nr:high-affinity nickel transport protein [Microsporum canis CBS 113480]EEQ31677.1 high-affinity nickel transport protein [Microsporum canis CBS 113480]
MEDSVSPSSPVADDGGMIDLSSCPTIFVLPTHISLEELHSIESILSRCGAPLTYDITEARLAIGKVSHEKRAVLELRSKGLWTESVPLVTEVEETARKRRRLDDDDKSIQVVNLNWIHESLKAKRPLPIDPFIVYQGHTIPKPPTLTIGETSSNLGSPCDSKVRDVSAKQSPAKSILERAREDVASSPTQFIPYSPPRRMKVTSSSPSIQKQRPKLYRASTSDLEGESIPDPPEWVRNNVVYSCCRSTPLHPPNEEFINQLQMVKKIRELTLDEVGIRAYSTSIASLAAYPHKLKLPEEVVSLPGCENRIANLFAEWKHSKNGTLDSATPLTTDPALSVIHSFYNIWGVGAKSAREFYYQRQWRDLDDIVEQGWDTLSRVQQIGVKYYDEFLAGIPREETASIAATIWRHAKRVRPDADFDGEGVEYIIVGGYRRGKEVSGDVDVILTHRDERVTSNLVFDVVASLEQEGWITHTLALHLTNTNRDQQTLPYRGEASGKPRFDSLDKALVVWQDPHFENTPSSSPSSELEFPEDWQSNSRGSKGEIGKAKESKGKMKLQDHAHQGTSPGVMAKELETATARIAENPRKTNPNLHRRVDIIVSPFRTIGCAVLGWSGDTTFQRDLRRYAKKVHNWKFDSSGVRSRDGSGGRIIDLESKGKTWQEREKLVMEGLGIGWRPPTERCTR